MSVWVINSGTRQSQQGTGTVEANYSPGTGTHSHQEGVLEVCGNLSSPSRCGCPGNCERCWLLNSASEPRSGRTGAGSAALCCAQVQEEVVAEEGLGAVVSAVISPVHRDRREVWMRL